MARALAAALTILHCSTLALAGDLAEFNAAVETASAHNRIAIGYLRTGNADLASLEIDRFRQSWGAVAARFANPPDAFGADIQRYRNTILDVSTQLVTVAIMMSSGRPDNARDILLSIRNELSDLRAANGIVVLADCVREANAAMDALYVHNDRDLDWNKPDIRYDVAAKASVYSYVLNRCDGMADKTIKASPEFRRLIDGAQASLALVPKAIATGDTDLLHRVLIELRSFDNLLSFRYG